MKLFKTRSLRFKIYLVLSIFVILLAALGILMLSLARDALEKELIAQGFVIVRRLAESHAYQVSLGLADELHPMLKKMVQTEPGIEYAEFVDIGGRIIRTGDGLYAAQSDSRKRLPEGAFRNHPEAQQEEATFHLIHEEGGMERYGFSAPVRLSVKRPGRSVPEDFQSEGEVIGAVRIVMVPETLHEAMNRLRTVWLMALAFALVVAILSSYVVTSFATEPVLEIANAASRLAQGDLKQDVRATTQDELGKLAESFNGMAENLTRMVRRIQDAYTRVDQGREEIRESVVQMMDRSRFQAASLDEVSAALSGRNSALQDAAQSIEALSSSAEQTSSSILEMASSIEEVDRQMNRLASFLDDTASSITETATSIQQVDRNVDSLNQLIADTAVSIQEMQSSIHKVERNTVASQNLSEQVAMNAELGLRSVEQNRDGMNRIRATVAQSSAVVMQLGRSSEEIGKIITVIDDVAEQTNLLALNAAIIAAQAGEHGKSFAVVAEEIRELAERTASSTKEIDGLIRTVQTDVNNAIQSMKSDSRIVEDGAALSIQSTEHLETILKSARSSADMAREIAKATEEQALGIQSIHQAVEQISEMMQQIRTASSEQKTGSEQIMIAVDSMREMMELVGKATSEQSLGSKQITQAMEHVTQMVSQILSAAGEQARNSEQVLRILRAYHEIHNKNVESVEDTQRALRLLMEQTNILKQEISTFKI